MSNTVQYNFFDDQFIIKIYYKLNYLNNCQISSQLQKLYNNLNIDIKNNEKNMILNEDILFNDNIIDYVSKKKKNKSGGKIKLYFY